VLLRGFPASPQLEKVRIALRYKALAFDEEAVRLAGPLRRTLDSLAEPTLIDGDTTIGGATRILAYLEDGHPERPLYPGPPHGARVRLVEQWVDEVLCPAVQAALWLVKTNFLRSRALLLSAYGRSGGDRLFGALFVPFRELVAWRVEGAPSWLGRDAARLNRLAADCDHLDAVLAETGWAAGSVPTAADLAAYAALKPLEGMDGWETARGRKRIAAWMRGVEKHLGAGPADAAADVVDVAEAQAFVDARRLSAKPKSA
jgi:glutathione S-transferase